MTANSNDINKSSYKKHNGSKWKQLLLLQQQDYNKWFHNNFLQACIQSYEYKDWNIEGPKYLKLRYHHKGEN